MNFFCRFLPRGPAALLVSLVMVVALASPLPAQTLRVGMVPEQDLFTQKQRYEPLFEYLGRQLGLTFELQVLPRHGMVAEQFAARTLDAAFFGALTAAMTIESSGMVPLARPHHTEGLASDYGIVFARRQSAIHSAADLRDKRLVFVDQASATGYLLALRYFSAIGIDDYRSWFAHYYFAGTHEDTLFEVLDGYADVGVIKSSIFYRIVTANPDILERLEILDSSPHVPAITFGVQADLAADLLLRLRQLLLNMHQNDAGRMVLETLGVQRFLPTTVDDFLPLQAMARQLSGTFAGDPDAVE